MGRRSHTLPGLYQRPDGFWQLDKGIKGYGRLRESTGTREYAEAERYALKRIDELQEAARYGIRPPRSFRQAATKYLWDEQSKKSIARDAQALKLLDPYLGDLPLDRVHEGTIKAYVADRGKSGTKQGTINRDLAVVRRILNLAARVWRHESGMTWLATAPLIQLKPDRERRKPYPISWVEQRLLLAELPTHLANMALYALHTGSREAEIYRLQWQWEIAVPELSTSVFLIPASDTKANRDRVIVLNRVAKSVVDSLRGDHSTFVFTYKGKPLNGVYNSAWLRGREKAANGYPAALGSEAPWGFRNLRVHDLRHTLGRRARAAGISLEDREDILGHASKRMTTHYSAAELGTVAGRVKSGR